MTSFPESSEEKVCEMCDAITHCFSIISQINNIPYDFCPTCCEEFKTEEQRILNEIENLRRGAGKKLGGWFARAKAVKRLNSRQGKLFGEVEDEGESQTGDPTPGDMGLPKRNPRGEETV